MGLSSMSLSPFQMICGKTREQFVTIPGHGRIEILNNAPGYDRRLSGRKSASPPAAPKRLAAKKSPQRSVEKDDRSEVAQFRREFGNQGAIWFAQGLSLSQARARVAQRERDESARFRKAFGDRGAVWFAQGLTFSEAKVKFKEKNTSPLSSPKAKSRAGFAAKIARSLARPRR